MEVHCMRGRVVTIVKKVFTLLSRWNGLQMFNCIAHGVHRAVSSGVVFDYGDVVCYGDTDSLLV